MTIGPFTYYIGSLAQTNAIPDVIDNIDLGAQWLYTYYDTGTITPVNPAYFGN